MILAEEILIQHWHAVQPFKQITTRVVILLWSSLVSLVSLLSLPKSNHILQYIQIVKFDYLHWTSDRNATGVVQSECANTTRSALFLD